MRLAAKGNQMENQANQVGVTNEVKVEATPVPTGFTRTKFSFRKPTEAAVTKAEAEGRAKPIERKSVEIDIKLLTQDDLAKILTGTDEKAKDLLLGQANQVVIDAVRSQLDDQDNHVEIDTSKVDLSKADFVFIANLPPAQRTGGGIPAEEWDAWTADYVATLVRVAGKTENVAANSANIFKTNLKEYRFSQDWLKALQGNLQTWFTNSTDAAEYVRIFERLNARLGGYLKDSNSVASGLI